MISDCPQSINNIPLDARNHGYKVLDIQQDGPTIRYLISVNAGRWGSPPPFRVYPFTTSPCTPATISNERSRAW